MYVFIAKIGKIFNTMIFWMITMHFCSLGHFKGIARLKLVSQSVLELFDLQNILHVLINKPWTTWPIEILMSFMRFSENLLHDVYIIFQNKCWQFWVNVRNMLKSGVGWSFPLICNLVVTRPEWKVILLSREFTQSQLTGFVPLDDIF